MVREAQALAANIVNCESEMKSKPMALVLGELFIDFLALSCRKAVSSLSHLSCYSSWWWRSPARR